MFWVSDRRILPRLQNTITTYKKQISRNWALILISLVLLQETNIMQKSVKTSF